MEGCQPPPAEHRKDTHGSSVPRGDDRTPSAREFIGENRYTQDDGDWHRVTFQEGRTHTITVSAAVDEPEEHRLNMEE